MNTAVAEGHDLGWKLAWVHRGWAGPDLLDTYEAEWRPVGARRAARSADPGPEASGPEALAEDLNGRLPHAWLPQSNGDRRSTLDLLGPGLTLLTGPDPRPWTAAPPPSTRPPPWTSTPSTTAPRQPSASTPTAPSWPAPTPRSSPTGPPPPPTRRPSWPRPPPAGSGNGLQQATKVVGRHTRLPENGQKRPARERTSVQRDDDRRTSLIVEELAMAALDADWTNPARSSAWTSSRPETTGSLVTRGCGRQPMRAPGSRRPPGRGCPRSRARALP